MKVRSDEYDDDDQQKNVGDVGKIGHEYETTYAECYPACCWVPARFSNGLRGECYDSQ